MQSLNKMFITYSAKYDEENPACRLNSKLVVFLYHGASYPLYEVTLIGYKFSLHMEVRWERKIEVIIKHLVPTVMKERISIESLNFMLLIHWFELQTFLLMYIYLIHSPSVTQITLVLLLHEQ